MSTKINLTYKKQEYTLEYSRQSVKQMEDQGFVLDQVGDKPATMIPLLVYGAFMKNHRGIKRSLVDEIYENVTGKLSKEDGEGFLATLMEMCSETINSLTDSAPADEGNVAVWKVTKG